MQNQSNLHMFLIAAILLSSISLFAVIEIDINYSPDDFIFEKDGEYAKVYLENGALDGKPGSPQLVSEPISVLLPPGERAIKTNIIEQNWQALDEDINIYPFQEPYILPIPGIYEKQPGFTPQSYNIYNQDKWYPEQNLTLTKTGNKSGYKIAGMIIKPIRYNPKQQKLEYLASCRIQLETAIDSRENISPERMTPVSHAIIQQDISNLVINPEMLSGYNSLYDLDPDAYDVIFVVTEAYQELWSDHSILLRQKGLRDTMIVFEDAVTTMPGRDYPEKLREMIKQTYLETGASFLLIGGDIEIIPSRWLFAMYSDGGVRDNEDHLHSDLYYADMDGDFDANENDLFGEVDDGIDLYQEMYPGRISVFSPEDIDYTDKLSNYEKTPDHGYLDNTLFIAQILWDDPYTDSGIGKDHIGDSFLPESAPVTKHYESEGTHGRMTSLDAIEAGKNIINHSGHGFWSIMGVGGHEYLSASDMADLSNSSKFGVLYSIGCWCAAFDYDDCVAEEYVMNPNGGGVAYYGNSRYGWGSPGNPGFGYSDVFDREFYRALFHKDITISGMALAHIKQQYIPYSHWANIWRWHQYEINLLGDPTFFIRRGEPKEITLYGLPVSLPPGDGIVSPDEIAIEDMTVVPAGIRLSLLVNGELEDAVITTITGIPELAYSDVIPGDAIEITATGPDMLPFSGLIEVASDMPYLSVNYHGIRDTLDGEDGQANAGDDIIFEIMVKNPGSEDAEDFSIISSDATMISDASYDIPAGDSVIIAMAYAGEIPDGRLPGYIDIEYTFESSVYSASGLFSIPYHKEILEITNMTIAGGEDYALTPGEEFWASIRLINTGIGTARDIDITILPGECALSITEDVEPPDFILPGDSVNLRFEGRISDEVGPVPALPFIVDIEDTVYNFFVVLNNGQLFDDAEGGMRNFTHGGINDDWHITEMRSHSETSSFWCGNEDTETYRNNTDAWLKSNTFYTGEESNLSFWLYMDITNYGTDGVYVEYIYDGDTITLDYIGSGGALGTLPFMTGWCEYSYDLDLPGAAPIEILFNMVTDTIDVREGCYIDDIRLGQNKVKYINSVDERMADIEMPEMLDFHIFPNPFNSSMDINIEANDGNIDVSIFDTNGRVIHHYEKIDGPGILNIDMEDYPSGTYTVKIKSQNGQSMRKAVLIK
ncbi:MAG: C25 family cysteine peptidase [Candidatus Zixiibacteriota bacterium]